MFRIFFNQGNHTLHRFAKLTKWPLRILLAIGVIALFAPVIANEQPLYINYKGNHLFPALSLHNSFSLVNDSGIVTERLQYDITEWKKIPADFILFPPVPYSPGKSDLINADYLSPSGNQLFENNEGKIIPMPFQYRHWLGTGKKGDDVLAGLIHGSRISFTVGIASMLIASFIGIFLGAISGYFGDYTIKISRGKLLTLLIGILPAWFFAFETRNFIMLDALQKNIIFGLLQVGFSVVILIIILFLFYTSGRFLNFLKWFHKEIPLPLDSIISRAIEIFISIPRLLVIIIFAAMLQPSYLNLVLIMGFMVWTDIARLTRAEFLRLRELDFITAARTLGYSNFRIILYHALPNGIAPVLVAIAFGAGAAILAESSLSFMGIGVPQHIVTWGSMLAEGNENIRAWWLIVFPGLAVFINVVIYNLLGEGLRIALLPESFKGTEK